MKKVLLTGFTGMLGSEVYSNLKEEFEIYLLSTKKINDLRISLIIEELNELKDAIKNNDLVETADALTDILFVTYGAGQAFGINLDKCFEEVQNSNMSKLGEDGKPIYNENGKVLKGPNYFKPNLLKIIS